MAGSNRIVIVNEHDRPIGLKGYPELRYDDVYRVNALWLTDKESGDILLQQRNWTKHNDPGKWQCAVSGTVDEGETYEQNIAKETEEEIGLFGLTITKGPKQYIDDGVHKFFCQWFQATTDKRTAKIVIQKSELEDYQWIDKATLIADVANNPDKYTPSMMDSMATLGVIGKPQKIIVAIAKQSDWEQAIASGIYTKSKIDTNIADVGFMHCSFPGQTIDIANRHFRDYNNLVLLLIDTVKVTAPIKYEGALSGRAGTFPHIYGPLNVDAIFDTISLQKNSEDMFAAPEQLNRLISKKEEQ